MTVEQRYRRERKRILQTIRRYKKKGAYVDVEIPKIPKKITEASVRRLEKITTKSLLDKAVWVDKETGEFMSLRERRRQKNREIRNVRKQHQKMHEEAVDVSKVICDNYANMLLNYPDNISQKTLRIFRQILNRVGYVRMAKAIDNMGDYAYRFMSGQYGQSGDNIDRWTDSLIANMPYSEDYPQEIQEIIDDVNNIW